MGLTTSELLEMTFWQYNAYCKAHQLRAKDQLAIQVQAAYLEAYWNSATKHKKSLAQMIQQIYQDGDVVRKPINFKAAEKDFESFEQIKELQEKGYAKI